MVIKFLRQKWKKIALIVLGSIAALVLIGAFLLNLYLSPLLASQLKSTVLSSTDSLYTIDFTDAEMHVLQGKIVVFNIDFKPDTAVYHRRIKQNRAPNNLYYLHIKKLVLTHMHPYRLYFKNKLDIGQIILSAPELHITYRLINNRDSAGSNRQTLYRRISKTLHSIHIGNILLNDVQFKYEDYSGNKVAISELKEMNIDATDLLIDSASQTDKSRFYFCKDVTTEINNFSGKTLSDLYRYKMKLLKLSTGSSQLNAEGIDVMPADTGVFFNKSSNDRFGFHLDSLKLTHFDFLSYHQYRKFIASCMWLSNGTLSVYNNPKPGAASKVDKSGSFPNAALLELNTDLHIDTILLKKINVNYTEHGKKSHNPGTITFNNTSGSFINVSTDGAVLAKNHWCNIQLSSYFMNRGRLDAALAFDLTDKDLAYSYKGSLGPMNLQTLNPITIPLAMLKVTSGKLDRFDFDIRGNRYLANGKLTMLYNNLKVTLLKMDSVENKYKHLTIASFFANAAIIKHNNPDMPGRAARTFTVNFQRPPEFPFFKTVSKTLLGGIKASAGYSEQKEKEVKSEIAERAISKQERQIKKALRLQKREERKQRRELKHQQQQATAVSL